MILINLQGVMLAWLQLRAHEQNIAISSSVYSVLYAVTISLYVRAQWTAQFSQADEMFMDI